MRRPPPPFRVARVQSLVPRTPRLTRVDLAGPALVGWRADVPAASVRLLLPEPGGLVIPEWTGNEFLLPDGRRPLIRTLTPLDVDESVGRVAVEIVRHGRGGLHDWLARVQPGDEVGISGPGRGYAVDTDAAGYLLAGDESALPAIGQLLSFITGQPDRGAPPVRTLVELADPTGRLELGSSGPVEFLVREPTDAPGSALVEVLRSLALPTGWRVWVAGEAAAVQRVRKLLFGDLGIPRDHVAAHGYWKDLHDSPQVHRIPPGSPGILGDE